MCRYMWCLLFAYVQVHVVFIIPACGSNCAECTSSTVCTACDAGYGVVTAGCSGGINTNSRGVEGVKGGGGCEWEVEVEGG